MCCFFRGFIYITYRFKCRDKINASFCIFISSSLSFQVTFKAFYSSLLLEHEPKLPRVRFRLRLYISSERKNCTISRRVESFSAAFKSCQPLPGRRLSCPPEVSSAHTSFNYFLDEAFYVFHDMSLKVYVSYQTESFHVSYHFPSIKAFQHRG